VLAGCDAQKLDLAIFHIEFVTVPVEVLMEEPFIALLQAFFS
jgi:hypothetical protein